MLAGTLVTAIGFMPNGFAKSTAGEYTRNMFWIVGIALIASWVVAVVFTPYLGVKLLPNIAERKGGHAAIYDTPHYNRFRRGLGVVIRRKWLVAASVVGVFVVAIVGMAAVEKQFFPTSDRPGVLVEARCRMGRRSSRPDAATARSSLSSPSSRKLGSRHRLYRTGCAVSSSPCRPSSRIPRSRRSWS
jgi:multidrug efflux pump subunit AcrB